MTTDTVKARRGTTLTVEGGRASTVDGITAMAARPALGILLALVFLLTPSATAQDGGEDDLPMGLSPAPAVSSTDDAALEGDGALDAGVGLGAAAADDAPTPRDSTFEQAVSDYRDGRFAQAFATFADLAQAEPDRARAGLLHANAGTAAARAERFGEAVWHLERALHLTPRDRAARRNLDMLRVELRSGVAQAEDLSDTLARLPLTLTPREARWTVAGLATLSLLLLMLRRGGVGGGGLTALVVVSAVLATAWWGADRAARESAAERAVVLLSAQVHGEPSETGRVLFRIDPGAVVRTEEFRGDWTLVETTAGGRGWLRSEVARAVGD